MLKMFIKIKRYEYRKTLCEMESLKGEQEDVIATRVVVDCNRLFRRNIYCIMQPFGGCNPEFGVNHVYWCFMCHVVYYFYVP